MLSEIEDAVAARIEDRLSDAAGYVAVQRGLEGIPKPAVYVAVESGKLSRVTSEAYKQTVTGYCFVVFSHLGGEDQRRRGVFPILEGILQAILLQTLGLDISPVVPAGFRNATTEEFSQRGLIVFSLEFETSYILKKLADEIAADLLRVGLNYYLQDPSDDDVADASDLLERQLPFTAGVSGARDRLYEDGLGLARPVEP